MGIQDPLPGAQFVSLDDPLWRLERDINFLYRFLKRSRGEIRRKTKRRQEKQISPARRNPKLMMSVGGVAQSTHSKLTPRSPEGRKRKKKKKDHQAEVGVLCTQYDGNHIAHFYPFQYPCRRFDLERCVRSRKPAPPASATRNRLFQE